MKRRSCQYYNLRSKKGPKGCEHGYKCKDGCKDYARKNGAKIQCKLATSLCKHLRYRYPNGVSTKSCAMGMDMNRGRHYDPVEYKTCSQDCPLFERRVVKHREGYEI